MPRPFFDTVRDLRYGNFLDEAGVEFQKVIQSVQDTNKPAELIIRLKVKPASHSGAYQVDDVIETKLPKLPRGSTILFGTRNQQERQDHGKCSY